MVISDNPGIESSTAPILGPRPPILPTERTLISDQPNSQDNKVRRIPIRSGRHKRRIITHSLGRLVPENNYETASEAAHEKRTKTRCALVVTVYERLNTHLN